MLLSKIFQPFMLFFSLVDDVVITSKDEAKDMQKIIEKMCRKKLGFDLRSGDIVLGQFANLPNVGKVSRPTSSQCQFGCGISNMVGPPKKQDLWANINILKGNHCFFENTMNVLSKIGHDFRK